MKTNAWIIAVIGFIGSASFAYAEPTVADLVQKHDEMKNTYEQKSAAQADIIAEHEAMKKDYKRKFYINEKVTPNGKYGKMAKHCDQIIKDAKKLKEDYSDFAKWHAMQARELAGT